MITYANEMKDLLLCDFVSCINSVDYNNKKNAF